MSRSDWQVGRPSLVLVRPGIGPAAQAEPGPAILRPLRPCRGQRSCSPSASSWQGWRSSLSTLRSYRTPALSASSCWGLMAAASERLSILVYGEAKVSISFICLFAIAVLYGPAGVAVATPFAILSLHFPIRTIALSFLVQPRQLGARRRRLSCSAVLPDWRYLRDHVFRQSPSCRACGGSDQLRGESGSHLLRCGTHGPAETLG